MDNLPENSITEVARSDMDLVTAALFGDEPEQNVDEQSTDSEDADTPTIETQQNESTDSDSVEQEVPAIEPPKSWSAEEKEAFKLLPPDVQRTLSERDAKRNADISSRFNEVNEQRKQVEAERQKTLTERAQYVQALENQTNFIQYELGKKYGSIDFVKLSTENPTEAVKIQAEYARDKSQLEQTYSQLVQAKQVQTQETQHAYVQYLNEQNEKLAEFVPEWKDKSKRDAIKNDMVGYLMSTYKFTPQELDSLVDAREASIAYKAYLYDKAQAEFKAKKVSNAPKVQTASVNQSQGKSENQVGLNNKAKQALRNSNNTRQQASIIANLL